MNELYNLDDKCITIVKDLIEKYKMSEYMLQRIHNHIVNYLPNTLDNEFKNYEKRVNRNNYLTNEQHIFIQIFLSKNKYFYLPNNNFFYEYDNEKYLIVKEDDIIHKLLSTISNDRVLLQWKHKTKVNIIRQIKDRSLFSSIPETDTIQNVLSVLYPAFFYSKNSAKYFLTLIGDNILKKSSQIFVLVSQKLKQLLNELDNTAFTSIGNTNVSNNFITKYHENHSYENCRLIKINDNFSKEIWRELLKKIGLDLLCVAVHYSKRYEKSDKFIETKSDEELKTYTYYLKNTTPDNIVSDFCNKYIMETNSECKMEWKNLHFVWKQFLSSCNLPNVIYSNNLKNFIKERYSYDENLEAFLGITSKYLPFHIDFIKFWETTISIYVSSTDLLIDNEIEVDELCYLFKCWSKNNPDKIITNGHISEDNILKILKHFFPLVEIIEDKFILNVKCSMWNKNNDINNSFSYIKKQIKYDNTIALISFDEVYKYYCNYCNTTSIQFIVSKRYFEKYLYYKLSEYIVYDKFIEMTWLDK